jgi:hypothetical protein
MTFQEYVHALNTYMTLHPETKKMLVVYSSDDEGNDFDKVKFGPSCGRYKPNNRDFTPVKKTILLKGNAVCIN